MEMSVRSIVSLAFESADHGHKFGASLHSGNAGERTKREALHAMRQDSDFHWIITGLDIGIDDPYRRDLLLAAMHMWVSAVGADRVRRLVEAGCVEPKDVVAGMRLMFMCFIAGF